MASDLRDHIQSILGSSYRISRELGGAGMSRVFIADDETLGSHVVVKVLPPELAAGVNVERFKREIQVAAQLHHPNIVPVLSAGQTSELLWYTMPLVEGETLRALLDRERQLPLPDAIRYATDIAAALSFAQQQNIVHRDIKPENILIENGQALVADFGIARAIEKAADMKNVTSTGLTLGTPTYMSPEQAAAEKHLDGRSDLYSLGCVFYEMLAGEPPFTGASARTVIAKHINERPPSVLTVRPDLPVHIEKAINVSLAKAPADRFRTADEFVDALTHPGATPPSLAPQRATHAIGRRWPWIAASAVIVAASIPIAAHRLSGTHRPPVFSPENDPRRVAVLYFADLSADKSLGYLASGLTEGLIHELSGVSAIHVISRNGVKPFRDGTISADSIGRALRVGTMVEGGVQRSGDVVRVSVQLTNTRTQEVAGASFERKAGELFQLEDDLAQRVAELLRRRIGAQIRMRQRETATHSEVARDLTYRADRLRDRAAALAATHDTVDLATALINLAEADSLLVRAETADPSWLEPAVDHGWVALEAGRYRSGAWQARDFSTAIARATAVLGRDSLNAAALELRGTARYLVAEHLPSDDATVRLLLTQSLADLRNAVRIDTTRASAWGIMSGVRSVLGDVTGAERDAHTALDMDAYITDRADIFLRLYAAELMADSLPASWRWCLGGAAEYSADQRFMECQLTLLAEDPQAKPDPDRAWRLVAAADRADPPAHARAMGRAWLPVYRRMMAAIVLARARAVDSARAVAGRARRDVANDPEVAVDFEYEQALLDLTLGDRSGAIAELTAYLTARPTLRRLVGSHPRWRALRDDPRFKRLVQR